MPKENFRLGFYNKTIFEFDIVTQINDLLLFAMTQQFYENFIAKMTSIRPRKFIKKMVREFL